MKRILIILFVTAVALPVAALMTLLLSPFWRWLEAVAGIEAIGHSGPAGWCFVVIYFLTLIVGVGLTVQFSPR